MRYLFILFFLCSLNSTAQGTLHTFNEFQADSIIRANMEQWKIAGMAICIVQDGKLIYNKGFGFRDPGGKVPVTPETIFAMGSSAKAFTGAFLSQADAEGLIRLNEPVSKQVPIQFENEDLTRQVTFIDLLTHQSGIPGHDFVWLTQKISRDELFENIRYLPPRTGLRQQFMYNNILFAIAGFAGAKILDQTWEEAVRERLFHPLGMDSTSFSTPVEASGNFSSSFIYNGSFHSPLPFRDLELIAPSGGVYTTSTDLSKWLQMLLNEGIYRDEVILDSQAIEKMFHPYVVTSFPKKFEEHLYENYGLGWMVTNYRGKTHIHHGGNIDGFTSTVDLWPDQDLGIAILTNTAYANCFTEVVKLEIADNLLGLEESFWSERLMELQRTNSNKKSTQVPEPVEASFSDLTPEELSVFEGSYRHGAYGTIVFVKTGNSLTAKHGDFPLSFQNKNKNVFQETTILNGQGFTFIPDAKGEITAVKTVFPSTNTEITFDREN